MEYLQSSFSDQLPGTFEGTESKRARPDNYDNDDNDDDNDNDNNDDNSFNDANREVLERYSRIEDCSYVNKLVDYDILISLSNPPNPTPTPTLTPPLLLPCRLSRDG